LSFVRVFSVLIHAIEKLNFTKETYSSRDALWDKIRKEGNP
jgi:hypothetical protein